MNAVDRMINAAGRELARRLWQMNASSPTPPDLGPAGVESSTQTPKHKAKQMIAWAEEMIRAVLKLSPRQTGQDSLRAAFPRIVPKDLGAHPGLRDIILKTLAAETSWLLNLPRLARLAGSGLELRPALYAQDPDLSKEASTQTRDFSKVLQDFDLVAQSDFSVLLVGETGTGKEMLARRLHQRSARREGPFIALNCAALADNLLKSEVFGPDSKTHKGLSRSPKGSIQSARGGTLFLDEIAETSPDFQVRLLKALLGQTAAALGNSRDRPMNFRLVCATHMDLDAACRQGLFNRTLLQRINIVSIWLPPLRRRLQDLPGLIEQFLEQACQQAGRTCKLSPQTSRLLLDYPWPGNVRELRHLIQRLVLLAPEPEISPEQLPAHILPGEGSLTWHRYMQLLAGVPGLNDLRQRQLTELLIAKSGATFSNKDVRESLGCSDSTAKNLLRRLCEEGVLEALGRRGGRRYRISPSRPRDPDFQPA